jgi:Rieske Fe-S protein
MTDVEATRRNVLGGLAAAAVAAPLLAACGGGNGDATAKTGGSGPIKTSEIPVGGGKIFPGRNIVVTQPTSGEFKAFSSICTHQGCPVTKISGGTIDCTCHGSMYSIADGSVKGGPAPRPLPEKTVTVTGDTITVS